MKYPVLLPNIFDYPFTYESNIKLKAGDILLFPSGIVYPHTVKETKKGIRYSFVSWAF